MNIFDGKRGFMQESVEIIIVDDQKLFRDTLTPLIEEHNIKVVGCAENGHQLFEILKKRIPEVILLDIEMSELDGSETLNRLKKNYPTLKTIVVSQYDGNILIQDFLNRGVNAYITKDTDVKTIAKAIHSVKKKGFYRDNLAGMEEKKGKNKRPFYKILFSRREREIIYLICKGKQGSDIAQTLSISEKTVESNITEIYRKAKVSNRSEFLIYAIQEGWNYLSSI